MSDGLTIRPETGADHRAVAALLEEAFPGPDEARLVERLRADGDMMIALVAEAAGEIVGHVAFSRMSAPFRALGLAPVAVRADRRRQGIADRLIRAGIDLARAGGWQALFVLGEPGYYDRFGFSASTAARYDCVYAGPYLMALPLAPDLPARDGAISYAPAFGALSGDQ